MMFLANTTPTKQARKTCLVKKRLSTNQATVYGCRHDVTLGKFVQLAMLFLATLLSTWVDVVLKLQSFECGSHSTLTTVRKCNYRK